MAYLDGSGLARLWSKIKEYVTNNHKGRSPGKVSGGVSALTFGDSYAPAGLSQILSCDEYGHVSSMVTGLGFILPNVECGTFTKGTANVIIEFTNIQNPPKIIKIYCTESAQASTGLSTVYSSDVNVYSASGSVISADKTGFQFGGAPGTFLWEAWG